MKKEFVPFASDCTINDRFVDANNPGKAREEYCREFCQYRCLKDQDYKRKNGERGDK